MVHLQWRDCMILKKRAKKWSFFSEALATRNELLTKPTIEFWPPPRWALISEPGGTPAEQPIIPLVMTYRPTNILVKNITRKLAPVTRYPNTAAIFQLLRILCAYRCDTNLHYSLVSSALDNTTSTYNYRVRSPVAGLDATHACILTHRYLLPNVTLRSNLSTPLWEKTWCMSSNVVPVRKCTSEKLGDASLTLI